MNTDMGALVTIAQRYFDAAYDRDADKFASLFHSSSSVSSVAGVGDDLTMSVTPIAAWLAAIRTTTAPRQLGLERHDEILSIDVVGELACLKVKLQIPPRYFIDILSCARIAGTWRIIQKVTRVDHR